jgi:hypothetical protein
MAADRRAADTLSVLTTHFLSADNLTDENDHSTHDLQSVHEPGVVWAFEVSQLPALDRDPGELGHRAFRIHLSSSGQPHRFIRVDCAAAKSAPGMHHADRLHARCFRTLSFAGAVELSRFLRAYRGRGLFRVQILGLCVQSNPHRASAHFARWTRSIFSWPMCTAGRHAARVSLSFAGPTVENKQEDAKRAAISGVCSRRRVATNCEEPGFTGTLPWHGVT